MSTSVRRRRRVVVIGGGIAGLAAAWHVTERAPDLDVVVLEADAVVGGKLRLANVAGLQLDVGAEALLARRPEGVDLIGASGLSDSLISPLTLNAAVHIDARNRPLPARTMLGIPGDIDALRASGVLSSRALAQVAAEPSGPPMSPLTGDVSVGSLVRDRLGDEVVQRLVEPLLGGVYAGRADRLSLAATMPALSARLRIDGGSLVEAAAAVTSAADPRDGPSRPVFVSLTGGLARLAQELGRSSRFAVRTGVTVGRLRCTAEGFGLECTATDAVENPHLSADAVIVAVPAANAADLLRGLAAHASRELATIETASMAIVTLAFADLALPAGSGLLVGTRADEQAKAIKAVTLSSQKWPGFPSGLTVLRASVGRIGQTRDLERDDEDLIKLVRAELVDLLAVQAPPIDSLVTRWHDALPQYTVGHVARVERIRRSVAGIPGLAVCGASYDGIGIPACIASAAQAVDQILATIT